MPAGCKTHPVTPHYFFPFAGFLAAAAVTFLAAALTAFFAGFTATVVEAARLVSPLLPALPLLFDDAAALADLVAVPFFDDDASAAPAAAALPPFFFACVAVGAALPWWWAQPAAFVAFAALPPAAPALPPRPLPRPPPPRFAWDPPASSWAAASVALLLASLFDRRPFTTSATVACRPRPAAGGSDAASPVSSLAGLSRRADGVLSQADKLCCVRVFVLLRGSRVTRPTRRAASIQSSAGLLSCPPAEKGAAEDPPAAATTPLVLPSPMLYPEIFSMPFPRSCRFAAAAAASAVGAAAAFRAIGGPTGALASGDT